MYRIGDFAKLSRVTVRTLRYYEEVGLLRPAQVDGWTGYRYYSGDQLPRLHRILALKDLGLDLDQIRALLTADLPAAELRGMLRLKQAELEQQVQDVQERLARVAMRLQQIEQEGIMPAYEVVLKQVPALRVAGVQDTIPDMEQANATFNRLFDEVCDYVIRHDGSINAPTLDLWYDDPGEQPRDMRVEACAPTASALPDSTRVRVYELPAVETMACVVHHGPFATLSAAYGAVMEWIQTNGYRIAGPNREIYLEYERSGDQANYVTEIQFPVAKA